MVDESSLMSDNTDDQYSLSTGLTSRNQPVPLLAHASADRSCEVSVPKGKAKVTELGHHNTGATSPFSVSRGPATPDSANFLWGL